ncbi:hypothetical protein IDJ77_10035 [Mucilaginibacter sp. ZT4R22]|uniref:Uncharacterized protein n=1 Tax=Mucilaginibacter pankratovii TaxID=2772110 RepID=A0ABR7WRJ2_9SPHI|nr:hypothetical protein [Mucilaginibacter pankratovii]MBD1364147.1 hypothetical protein [Mucilaginibacter pankratovii]
MKRIICLSLLIGQLMAFPVTLKAQNKLFINPNPVTHHLNNGIPIGKTDFDNKVAKYLKMMMNGFEFDKQDYIDMVRIYNTIGWSFETPRDSYRLFYDAFLVVHVRPAVKKLNAGLSKGMSYYSPKYNLYIGDGPIIKDGIRSSDNSKFKVDTLR